MDKLLRRSMSDRMVAGVCSGLGNYLGIDPVVIRLVWALATLFSMGTGILVYMVAWIVIPEE
ncbi:PspC domain-containing protein [Methanolobus sp.]|jgi:phage shock protein C|uniref:PspC domain-containing protein n=1 Tax=Methanolobus sp. TaxID=1874737 RepID=UPI0025E975BF|nr:PspC domain-containing protein [Methanolobus sp.]